MPFTAARTIVALPFLRSRRFPAVAVACGAIAPDLPLYLTGGAGYDETHSLVAVPTIDLLLGLGCIAVWVALLRPGVAVIVPGLRPPMRLRLSLLPVPTAFGALTHVVWDAFSHAGRFGSRLVPAIDTWIGGAPLTAWVQYVSSVLGVVVLAVCAVIGLRHALRRADPTVWSVVAAVAVAGAGLGSALVAAVLHGGGGIGLRAETSSVLTSGCLAAALTLALVGLTSRVITTRRARRRRRVDAVG